MELLSMLQMGHALCVLEYSALEYYSSLQWLVEFYAPRGTLLSGLQYSKRTPKSELNVFIGVLLASKLYLPTVIVVYIIIGNLYHST